MNRTRRSLAACAILTAAVLAAAGCSSSESGKGSATAGETITYWSMWKQGEPQQQVIEQAIDSFTKTTGIKVDVQWSGRQVLQQVTARLSAGNPPDLFDSDCGGIVTSIGSVDGLAGLNGLFQQKIDGEDRTIASVIPANLMNSCQTKDGQPALVPYTISGSTLWYNGLAAPAVDASSIGTWDGFVKDLDARKAAGDTAIALDGDITDYDAYWLIWSILRHNGAGSFTAAADDKTGATWKSASYVASIDPILKLVKGGYFPKDFMGSKFPAQQTAWASAGPKAGYLLMGSWGPSETGEALKKSGKVVNGIISYKSVPFPTFGDEDKGDKVVQADVTGFAVAKRSRHQAAAEKFIAYFMNKDRLSGISTIAENLTPRNDIPAPQALAGYAAEYKQSGAQYVLNADGVGLKDPHWLTDVWQPAVTEFFSGKYATAQDFADQLAAKTASFHQSQG